MSGVGLEPTTPWLKVSGSCTLYQGVVLKLFSRKPPQFYYRIRVSPFLSLAGHLLAQIITCLSTGQVWSYPILTQIFGKFGQMAKIAFLLSQNENMKHEIYHIGPSFLPQPSYWPIKLTELVAITQNQLGVWLFRMHFNHLDIMALSKSRTPVVSLESASVAESRVVTLDFSRTD